MRKVLLAATALVLALTGCVQAVGPPPVTDADLEEYIGIQQQRQWSFIAPTSLEHPRLESRVLGPEQLFGSERNCPVGPDALDDTFACLVAELPHPSTTNFFSRAQLDYIYDYFQDSLVPCLLQYGLDVGYAPSREEFTREPGWLSWDPYSELGAEVPPSRAAELRWRCPPMPAGVR
jgi:hypothetical protein